MQLSNFQDCLDEDTGCIPASHARFLCGAYQGKQQIMALRSSPHSSNSMACRACGGSAISCRYIPKAKCLCRHPFAAQRYASRPFVTSLAQSDKLNVFSNRFFGGNGPI